ncbi:hypothetical protein ScPMuIL_000173 [Solemya velum]
MPYRRPWRRNTKFHARERRPKKFYGFFCCDSCDSNWESAHVYSKPGRSDEYYTQDCKKCDIACTPYKVEKLVCSQCHETNCCCEKRHNDPSKHHMAELCEKCRSGSKCQT